MAVTMAVGEADSRAVVRWQPAKLTNGSPVFFEVSARPGVQSVTATWMAHNLTFYRAGKTWCALGGVPLETLAGKHELKITETFANGRTAQIDRMIRVAKEAYPKITVKVAKQFTEPNKTQLTTISEDKELKQKTFSEISAQRTWSGPFSPPVAAPVSDVFGTERVFNGEVQSRHQGLDYAVPAGTAICAINAGTVILARPMFFEGNLIVIDHGQGLLSLYLHLSEFKVKEGEKVRGGDVIALSGSTGRATGAHLHLAVRWQGVYLNPAILLKLSIPPAAGPNMASVPIS